MLKGCHECVNEMDVNVVCIQRLLIEVYFLPMHMTYVIHRIFAACMPITAVGIGSFFFIYLSFFSHDRRAMVVILVLPGPS